MRSAAALAVLLLTTVLLPTAGALCAGELQVVDDFERGVSGWYPVDGRADKAQPPYCRMDAVGEAQQGIAAARLRFAACPQSWAHMQLGIRPVDWIGADCDRLALWLKGDGSGATLNLMLGNYERKPALCYVTPLKLDFTDWKQLVLPFADFTPAGLPANLGDIVLIQLNVSGTPQPVEVLVDDIVALPADRGGQPGRFSDLDVLTTNGWDLAAPTTPVAVDALLGVPASVKLPRMLHGVRNHRDLHNPVAFAVDYVEPGTFAVRVAKTSGYGGSSLILSVDGQEVKRWPFPGETETELTQYQGYYAIPVPAGKHVISVDNDGADWLQVEAYRFGNYGRGRVSVDRADSAVTVAVYGGDGKPLPGLTAVVRVIGKVVPTHPQADGTLRTAALREAFPAGRYPVAVEARRDGQVIFTARTTIQTACPLIMPERVAFPEGESVDFAVRVMNAAGVAVEGQPLQARLGRVGAEPQSVPVRAEPEGRTVVAAGKLAAGSYEVSLQGAGETHRLRLLVYPPAPLGITKSGIIKLGPHGRFLTPDGRDYTPWGFATIGVFEPTAEVTRSAGLWAFASDDAVRDWIALLKSYGVNVVRFGVNVGGMRADQGGHLQPDMAARLKHFLDLLGPLGVRALPVMWWGHYRNFDFKGIPAYDALIKTQADWFTNAEALALQQQYVREVVAPYATDPRIFAWEVMNETYTAGGDRAAAIRWTNAIVGAIHEVDRNHLTTTSAAEATPDAEIEWITGAQVDFFNWHAYPTYMDYGTYRKQAGNDTVREMGNYAAMMALADAGHGRVVILGEAGNDRGREVDYPEFKTLITRDCLWLAFLCGSPGAISWDAIADLREFDVLSRIVGACDWRSFRPVWLRPRVGVQDYARDLGNLARYSWWALEHGVPLVFGEPAVGCLFSERFAPPSPPPPVAVQCSTGYQSRYLESADGKLLIAYVRNVGDILPQNVRTRTARPLQLTLLHRAGTWQVWDLDERRIVKTVSTKAAQTLDLGVTDHDFALVCRGR